MAGPDAQPSRYYLQDPDDADKHGRVTGEDRELGRVAVDVDRIEKVYK